MENAQVLQNHHRLTLARTWKFNRKHQRILLPKTVIAKPITHSQLCLSSVSHPNAIPQDRVTLLKASLDKLRNNGSCPLQILRTDHDWSEDHFWAVVRLLKHSSRSAEILPVFDMWKNMEGSRINEFNYEKIIELLGDEGLMEEATSAFLEMKCFGISPSLRMYNSIIHAYARNGKFTEALLYLNEMKEINLPPESETYDGLIQAYGKYKMYDEMGLCLKKMEFDGCLPDNVTYNLLIQEFARGGLLSRMERIYQSMRTKRMNANSATLLVMLEAYANFGIVEKMEKILKRVHQANALIIKEELMRKVAGVYIENYMFSRLDNLAYCLTCKSGMTDFVWCLRLLSHACRLSKKGMDSVVGDMKEAKVSWNVTFANIILLASLKMKDFTHLRLLLFKVANHVVKPDIVTVGIFFDAKSRGFDGAGILETWKKRGLLCTSVEMNTDPLVLTAFGKGEFLRKCEDSFTSLEPKAREKNIWNYSDLINLVANYNGSSIT